MMTVLYRVAADIVNRIKGFQWSNQIQQLNLIKAQKCNVVCIGRVHMTSVSQGEHDSYDIDRTKSDIWLFWKGLSFYVGIGCWHYFHQCLIKYLGSHKIHYVNLNMI
ncbi:hypothetical protein MNBD_GAMMA02-266 [hydrothermal vent metagenome]|uniref:Uncharacterized protein n=1 Tax=hydrothermal vent metagenome TaxID=652676 RepID=A0A3B0VR95_9ZZZZ